MPATISALLRRRDLGLTLLTTVGPDVPIRWVATSELTDPTPYLRGGELLLTTGMRLPRERSAADAYVTRLVQVGVVALGLGVGRGLAHLSAPPRLVRAAETRGLPLLVVDEPTPFIAIGEAVGQMQFADETAALAQALHAQQSLTRAAVTGGRDGVVRQLARLLRGWVVVADPAGSVLAQAPQGAAEADLRWRREVRRMSETRLGSAALAGAGNYVSIHALGDGSRVRGYLVTGRDHQPSAEHTITAVAAALLTTTMAGSDQVDVFRAARREPVVVEPNVVAAGAADLTPLDALRPRTRDTLIVSLRTWLAHHGRYDPAASALGVHRNTLRYRISRLREVLDVDLDDPSVRMRLWSALDVTTRR